MMSFPTTTSSSLYTEASLIYLSFQDMLSLFLPQVCCIYCYFCLECPPSPIFIGWFLLTIQVLAQTSPLTESTLCSLLSSNPLVHFMVLSWNLSLLKMFLLICSSSLSHQIFYYSYLTHARYSVTINWMNNHGNKVTQTNSPFLLKRDDRISDSRGMDTGGISWCPKTLDTVFPLK